jgi:hypothetical protein
MTPLAQNQCVRVITHLHIFTLDGLTSCPMPLIPNTPSALCLPHLPEPGTASSPDTHIHTRTCMTSLCLSLSSCSLSSTISFTLLSLQFTSSYSRGGRGVQQRQ